MKRITDIRKNWMLYVLILPAFIYIIIFCYVPMYGVQIAFKDFHTNLGILGSDWVGLKYFERFFKYSGFWRILGNTLGISVYSLTVGFPIAIILAIMMNEVRSVFFKKTIQLVTYAPHFLSVVVICGLLTLFLKDDTGVINNIIHYLGGERVSYLIKPKWFKTIFVLSEVWQNSGWKCIIYMCALSGVDPQIVESSRIDGANRLQKIWHIDLPYIMPTIIIMFILSVGALLTVGDQKILLLQNPLNMETSDVIGTYVYRVGIIGAEYSYTAAIGLFNNLINLILLISANTISRKLNETSLW